MAEQAQIPLKVGDKLWYVRSRHLSRNGRDGGGHEVEVTKVGRKWATIGEGWGAQRIAIKTLEADGGQYSSPGCCYPSKEAYDAERAIASAWEHFVSRLARNSPPAGVTLEWINSACRQLGIPLAEKSHDGQ